MAAAAAAAAAVEGRFEKFSYIIGGDASRELRRGLVDPMDEGW